MPRYRRPQPKEAQTLGRLGILTNEVVVITVSTLDGVPIESAQTDLFEEATTDISVLDPTFGTSQGTKRSIFLHALFFVLTVFNWCGQIPSCRLRPTSMAATRVWKVMVRHIGLLFRDCILIRRPPPPYHPHSSLERGG